MAYKKIRICRITFFICRFIFKDIQFENLLSIGRENVVLYFVFTYMLSVQSLEFVEVGIVSDEYIRK